MLSRGIRMLAAKVKDIKKDKVSLPKEKKKDRASKDDEDVKKFVKEKLFVPGIEKANPHPWESVF